ncbi:unnamed protein product [Symbiodinium sp. KB8]|nr:unnamed protein product [Symbiodinium sp. KB8]
MTRHMEERKPDFKKRKEAREAVFGRESDVPRENADGIPTLSVDGTMGTRKTFTEIREKAVVVRATRSWPLLPAGNSRVTCTSPAIPNAVLPEFEEFIDTELAEEADFIEEMDDQMDIAGDED